MATVRFRRGRWVLDYRDSAKKRVVRTYESKQAAQEAFARLTLKGPVYDPAKGEQRLTEYAPRWLTIKRGEVKTSTFKSYEYTLRLHILPALGHIPLAKLQRGSVRLLWARSWSLT